MSSYYSCSKAATNAQGYYGDSSTLTNLYNTLPPGNIFIIVPGMFIILTCLITYSSTLVAISVSKEIICLKIDFGKTLIKLKLRGRASQKNHMVIAGF